MTTLLAVPNVSEGRDASVLQIIARGFASAGARILHASADADHHRAVFTLAGAPGRLAEAVAAGAERAVACIDMSRHRGEHPRVGAIDVAPIVHLSRAERGAACAEALILAELLGELGLRPSAVPTGVADQRRDAAKVVAAHARERISDMR